MADGYILSESDREILNKVIKEYQNRPTKRTIPGVPGPDPTDPASPIYVAYIPTSGIPAYSQGSYTTGTGTGTRLADDVLSSELCDIYQVVRNDDVATLEPIANELRVYNLGDAIDGDQWVIVVKERFGAWLAINPGSAGGSSLTVEEEDTDPSYPNVTTLQFDQDDGFVVTQPSVNKALVGLRKPSVVGSTAGDSSLSVPTSGITLAEQTSNVLLAFLVSLQYSVGPINATAIVPPTGWTTLQQGQWGSSNEHSFWLGYIIYDGSTTNWTWGVGGLNPTYSQLVSLPRAGTPTVLDAVVGTGTSADAPSINALANASILTCFFGATRPIFGTPTFVVPSGMTRIPTTPLDVVNTYLQVDKQDGIVQGATGTKTCNFTSFIGGPPASSEYVAIATIIPPVNDSLAWAKPAASPDSQASIVPGAPPASLGSPGSVYFDVSDPSDIKFYYKE